MYFYSLNLIVVVFIRSFSCSNFIRALYPGLDLPLGRGLVAHAK